LPPASFFDPAFRIVISGPRARLLRVVIKKGVSFVVVIFEKESGYTKPPMSDSRLFR